MNKQIIYFEELYILSQTKVVMIKYEKGVPMVLRENRENFSTLDILTNGANFSRQSKRAGHYTSNDEKVGSVKNNRMIRAWQA